MDVHLHFQCDYDSEPLIVEEKWELRFDAHDVLSCASNLSSTRCTVLKMCTQSFPRSIEAHRTWWSQGALGLNFGKNV